MCQWESKREEGNYKGKEGRTGGPGALFMAPSLFQPAPPCVCVRGREGEFTDMGDRAQLTLLREEAGSEADEPPASTWAPQALWYIG